MKRNGKCGIRVWIIAVFYIALLWSNGLAQTATQPSGSGTQADPYQIATLDNLYWLSQNSSAWNKYFVQTADINAAATSGWNSGAGFSPIGNNDVYFQGTYNGQGHTISGLFIDMKYYDFAGLFGNAIYGTIQNLGLVDCSVRGGTYVGGLVGYGGSIKNCYTTGTVTGIYNYTGGLVGRTYVSYISQCYSTANVSGVGDVGGLIGRTSYTYLLSNCYATGDVTGTEDVGGLVGKHSSSTIDSCYSIGKVTGTTAVGGLVGTNEATVANSYYDSTTAKQSDTGKGTPKTTAEMQLQATFGWNFTNIWAIESDFNNGYPYLKWQSPEPAAPIATAPTQGDGSTSDPYQIASLENLRWLAEQVNSTTSPNSFSGVYFVQTVDVDASGTYFWDDGNGGTKEGWLPIGASGSLFSGNYNGNGHSISNLFINRPESSYIGLFGYISGGTVTNLTITNCFISGSMSVGGLAGALCGSYSDYAEISNCSVSGNVIASGQQSVGGLIGDNCGGTIKNCITSCSVTGYYSHVGGLVGINSGGTYDYGIINSCKATGTVKGVFYVGGLIGYNGFHGYIQQCCAYDSVRGANPPDGYCVRFTGGLVGMNYNGQIDNSFTRGFVHGDDYVGGLVGYNDAGTVANCYSTGEVYGSTNVGGFAGGTSFSISNSFYDSTTAGQNDTGKGTPKNTAQMKTLSTFYNNGWDFEIEDANGTFNIWDMDSSGSYNNGYPFLAWQNGATVCVSLPTGTAPLIGNGTKASPFEIASFANLTWVTVDTNNWDKHYIQTADINASETRNGSKWIFNGWMPIGKDTKSFTGSYDGNGHIIDSLYISRASDCYVGLFGYTFGDTVCNLGATNVTITGKDRVGALIGFSNGTTVQECFTTGGVSGKEYIGGLIGLNYQASVKNCYSMAGISGTYQIGGLVGRHENSNLINCYSTGSVGSCEYAGGLVGRQYNSTTDNCFWDTETSGKTASQGGTDKTTAEMKTLTTFTSAGWDFTDIWAINSEINTGYPYLQWSSETVPVIALSFSESKVDFGKVRLGNEASLTVTINNTGNDTLRINNIFSTDAQFIVRQTKYKIPVGESVTDTLGFSPTNEGAQSGYLIVESNAATSPDTIAVSGFSAIYRLTISPTAVDFGNVTIGLDRDTTLTLTNTGNDTLRISQIQSSNLKFSSKFSQFMVLPGANFVDTLWYNPDIAGTDSGLIIITSNADSSPDTIKVRGSGIPASGIADQALPEKFALSQNYPNPFNPTTTIAFALAKEATVTLHIYDLTGREVATLVNNELLAGGYYNRVWNAAQMPTGVYLCRIQAGEFSAVKKLVLVK